LSFASHIFLIYEPPDPAHPSFVTSTPITLPAPVPGPDIDVFQYEPMTFRIMRDLGVNPHWDDDMCQIAMMALLRAKKFFDHTRGCKFMTYAWRIVYQDVATELQRRRQANKIMKSPPTREEGVEDKGIDRLMNRQRVAMILKRLKKHERRILYDRYFKYRTLEGIAKIRGISKERVRQIQRSSEERIRREMVAA